MKGMVVFTSVRRRHVTTEESRGDSLLLMKATGSSVGKRANNINGPLNRQATHAPLHFSRTTIPECRGRTSGPGLLLLKSAFGKMSPGVQSLLQLRSPSPPGCSSRLWQDRLLVLGSTTRGHGYSCLLLWGPRPSSGAAGGSSRAWLSRGLPAAGRVLRASG